MSAIVGDRFVFQSEVLFAPGEAQISDAGKGEIDKLGAGPPAAGKGNSARDQLGAAHRRPHRRRPISTPQFPSNWELSAARAIAVAKDLVAEGVSPQRLVAAGFGEYSPIDTGDTEEAYRRNRRIEFKLTEG